MTTTTQPAGTGATPLPLPDRTRRGWRRPLDASYVGCAGAVVLFCLSLTPSLLPRGHLFQALISGVLGATGYAVGVLGRWLVQSMSIRPLPSAGRTAWRVLGGVSAVAVAVSVYLGAGWQAEVHRLAGAEPPPRWGFPIVLLVALLVAAALIKLARLLRDGTHRLSMLLGRWIPIRTARVVGALLVAVLLIATLNGVVADRLLRIADSSFAAVNEQTRPGVEPVQDPLRSGGPGSLVPWDTLGNEGRRFVAGGPSAASIERFGGPAPQRPIRVYAGLASAPTSAERADLVARELERTGAFDRQVLTVITTTGTGWVNSQAIDALDLMYHGDSAAASLQYSYLPSPLSFITDQERAREAGRDLFNAVYRLWSRLPVDDRPRLLVYGESLGSFGAESAFSGPDDVRNRTDGVLLVGPPHRNGLWTEIVEDRDPGSTLIRPVYRGGATVRFASAPADLDRPAGPWERSRMVYLQHASDPIVWWAPGLMFRRPDWLKEARGPDVSSHVHWFPFVTFWQVTADMAFSTDVPPGHGHRYGTAPVEAWARIAPPDGWTPEQTARLVEALRRDAD